MKDTGAEDRAAWIAYEHGDPADALPLFLSLAQKGKPYYLVVAARMYMDGRGAPKDYAKAKELLDTAMSVGVSEAILQRAALAKLEGDRESYVRFLVEADKHGQIAAKYYLGKCYLEGADLREMAKGTTLIKQACSAGHLGAKILMGQILLRNPTNVVGFLHGSWMLLSASAKHLYLAFKNPHDERIR